MCPAIVATTGSMAASATAAEWPRPQSEHYTETTLALMRYNRDLCGRLTDRLLLQWRAADRSDDEAMRAFVVQSLLADLTASRTANDIARDFLPTALNENNAETGDAIQRLFDLQGRLCDAAAYPTGQRGAFANQVTDLLLGIDAEQHELGRLLVIPDRVLEEALDPYLTAIQLAGVEAEGELVAYLESLRPKPNPPTKLELMQLWHRGYAEAVAPSKQALGRFLRARQAGERAVVGTSCKEISRLTIELLASESRVFRGPEPALARPLRSAFQELRRAAVACSTGDFRRADTALGEMRERLGTAARILRPYGLQP